MEIRHVLIAVASASLSMPAWAQSASPPRPAILKGELKVRYDIFDRVKALVDARDFAALNAMEREFRTSRVRTPSGVWKLSEFHGAVHAALPEADSNQNCAFTAGPLLKAWAAATPSAPTPYIALANMLVGRAWCFRGTGYAVDVPDDDETRFQHTIAAAYETLSSHSRIAAKDPEYYVVMEDIYRAQGRGRPAFQRLLDEASAKEPYYYELYAHAYYYNMPQWFGGYPEIEQAARYAVARTQDQDGLGAYARYYWNATGEGCDCWVHAIDWATMKKAMKDVVERNPEPWNLANFAQIACEMNDSVVAREYFVALGNDDGSEAWGADKEGWQKCRDFAATVGGPLALPKTSAPPGSDRRIP
jgi:hypothetical protein